VVLSQSTQKPTSTNKESKPEAPLGAEEKKEEVPGPSNPTDASGSKQSKKQNKKQQKQEKQTDENETPESKLLKKKLEEKKKTAGITEDEPENKDKKSKKKLERLKKYEKKHKGKVAFIDPVEVQLKTMDRQKFSELFLRLEKKLKKEKKVKVKSPKFTIIKKKRERLYEKIKKSWH